MSGRIYLLVVVLCALWLGIRTATQPIYHDFDEAGHLRTVAQIRELGGLPGSERIPDIIRPWQYHPPRVLYHTFPPYPYLVMAGATALVQTEPTLEGVLGVSRAVSATMVLIAILAAGLAVRILQPPESTWSAPAAVTVGLAILPSVHSMGASVTASTWAFAAVAGCVASIAWAWRRNWSSGSTLAVAGAVTFVIASRPSAYPVLILLPLALVASRLDVRAVMLRLAVVMAAVALVNGWWLLRSALVTGDLLGTSIYVDINVEDYVGASREGPIWRRAASTSWPVWTLLTSTDWFWLALSRILGRGLWLDRIVWVDPISIVLWTVMVLAPAVLVIVRRVGEFRDDEMRLVKSLLAGGIVAMAVPFFAVLVLSLQIGWFASIRDTFINATVLVVAVAALAGKRKDGLRSLCFGLGLAFAAATNAGFVLLMLP